MSDFFHLNRKIDCQVAGEIGMPGQSLERFMLDSMLIEAAKRKKKKMLCEECKKKVVCEGCNQVITKKKGDAKVSVAEKGGEQLNNLTS